MSKQQWFLAGAAAFAWMLSAVGVMAQYPGAPSQQEIETKLRGLPTLGTTPPAVANPAIRPTNVAPTMSDRAEPRRSQPHRAEPPRRHAVSPPPAHTRSPVVASTRSAPGENARPSMTLPTITFKFDSAELTAESVQTLENLGNALNQGLKDVPKFVIQGHTDRTGAAAYNQDLSKRRAEAVKDFLASKMGVDPERLEAVGLGFSDPANPRNPYAAENRRVVVINAGSS